MPFLYGAAVFPDRREYGAAVFPDRREDPVWTKRRSARAMSAPQGTNLYPTLT